MAVLKRKRRQMTGKLLGVGLAALINANADVNRTELSPIWEKNPWQNWEGKAP